MHERMAKLLLRRGDNVMWHGERSSFFGRRHLDCSQKMEIDLRRPALGAGEKKRRGESFAQDWMVAVFSQLCLIGA